MRFLLYLVVSTILFLQVTCLGEESQADPMRVDFLPVTGLLIDDIEGFKPEEKEAVNPTFPSGNVLPNMIDEDFQDQVFLMKRAERQREEGAQKIINMATRRQLDWQRRRRLALEQDIEFHDEEPSIPVWDPRTGKLRVEGQVPEVVIQEAEKLRIDVIDSKGHSLMQKEASQSTRPSPKGSGDAVSLPSLFSELFSNENPETSKSPLQLQPREDLMPKSSTGSGTPLKLPDHPELLLENWTSAEDPNVSKEMIDDLIRRGAKRTEERTEDLGRNTLVLEPPPEPSREMRSSKRGDSEVRDVSAIRGYPLEIYEEDERAFKNYSGGHVITIEQPPAVRDVRQLIPPGEMLEVALWNNCSTSALEAPVIAFLTKPFYIDGKEVIPANSKILGTALGKRSRDRIGVQFHTLVLPNRKTLSTSGFALDVRGESGIPGKIIPPSAWKHVIEIAAVFASSYQAGRVEYTVDDYGEEHKDTSSRNATRQATSNAIDRLLDIMTDEFTNEQPYVLVLAGTRCLVFLENSLDISKADYQ